VTRPSVHPSIPSSIHGWHHTGKKTLAEINNPPLPSAHVSLSKKGMPGPRGGGGGQPQYFFIKIKKKPKKNFNININNKPNIYFNKNYIYEFQIAFISKT
jgi:hypothetical protein